MTRTLLAVALLIVAMPLTASAQLMDAELQARLEKALPTLASKLADDALHGRLPGRRLFYTGQEIEHAQQSGAGDRVGFHLSAHNRSRDKDGLAGTDFEFPWKNPGGTDDINVYVFKVMFLPNDAKVRVHRTPLTSFFGGQNGNVFFGRGTEGNVNGYGWTFPDGTRFYEMLSFGDRLSVFEVRTRIKDGDRWRVNLFRPFASREDFAEVVDGFTGTAKSFTLSDKNLHRNKSAFNRKIEMEEIPGLPNIADVDMLLRSRAFASVLNRDWSSNAVAPWSRSETSIVPKDYNGAFVGNTTRSCQQCHQDAGTHVRFFDADREWYGHVRGEPSERILSFHPVDPSAVSRNGTRVAVKLNEQLLAAGLIEDAIERSPVVKAKPAQQPAYSPQPRRLFRR